MPTQQAHREPRISLTISLPQHVVERIDDMADRNHATREDECERLIVGEFVAQQRFESSFDELSSRYQARQEQEGRAGRTREQILDELRNLRQSIADEINPF